MVQRSSLGNWQITIFKSAPTNSAIPSNWGKSMLLRHSVFASTWTLPPGYFNMGSELSATLFRLELLKPSPKSQYASPIYAFSIVGWFKADSWTGLYWYRSGSTRNRMELSSHTRELVLVHPCFDPVNFFLNRVIPSFDSVNSFP